MAYFWFDSKGDWYWGEEATKQKGPYKTFKDLFAAVYGFRLIDR